MNEEYIIRKQYMANYYNTNRSKIIELVQRRRTLLRNSDTYIQNKRDIIIEELNNGKRRYVHTSTLNRYNIKIDPKTLIYYHDKNELLTKLDDTISYSTITASPDASTIDQISNYSDPNLIESNDYDNVDAIDNYTIEDILSHDIVTEMDINKLKLYCNKYKHNKNRKKKAFMRQIKLRFKIDQPELD